jgi:nucleoside-diphosphate-sugar epimerase
MNEILLLGSSGYIGKNITNAAESKSIEVLQVDSKKINLLLKKSISELSSLISKSTSLIISSAITRTQSDTFYTYKQNMQMVQNIVDSCKLSVPKNICFLSSADVYGDEAGRLISDSTRLNPKTFYGDYKVEAETLIRNTFNKIIPIHITRFSGVYGG